MREEDGSVYGWRRALGTRAGRVRALGVAFTLMCALLGMLAVITPGDGPGVGGVAARMMMMKAMLSRFVTIRWVIPGTVVGTRRYSECPSISYRS